MGELILAVDQGTTGTTVLVTDAHGSVRGRGYHEHPQHFPQPGWVEHDPEAIWQSVLDSVRASLDDASASPADIAGVGITDQRETLVAWDAHTGAALAPAIVWQDRRTATRCEELRTAGFAAVARRRAGLPVDPYFTATKLEWLIANNPDVRNAAERGTLRVGTIDSWLVHRMSAGAAHVTDASNAARTLLCDIHTGTWSDELCAVFNVDPAWLPTIVDCSGPVAITDPAALLGIDAPVCGMAGDQQSALFGQACVSPGQAKATYGTGAFVLVNNGAAAPGTESLISTIAWQLNGERTYALEGSVFTAGASVQWLRDQLRIVETAPDVEALAASVPDSGGVVVVPAFAGIGAPIWDANARAAVLGLTRGSSRAHIARATLEGVACRVRQLIDAMRAEGTTVSELRVDGGMAANDLLMQLQADVLGLPVLRPTNVETTSLGAALLAAHGCGLLPSLDDVAGAWQLQRRFEPRGDARADAVFERFERAVDAVRQFGH